MVMVMAHKITILYIFLTIQGLQTHPFYELTVCPMTFIKQRLKRTMEISSIFPSFQRAIPLE